MFLQHYAFSILSFYLAREVIIQVEGLLVELTLSSCYDFVEHSCDFVLKHLSVLQKLRYESVLMIYIQILMNLMSFFLI